MRRTTKDERVQEIEYLLGIVRVKIALMVIIIGARNQSSRLFFINVQEYIFVSKTFFGPNIKDRLLRKLLKNYARFKKLT